MSSKITRRDVVKSIAGLAVGAELTALSSPAKAEAKADAEPRYLSTKGIPLGMKVSPPGPKSLELLKRVKESVGKTNYTGLYSIALARGSLARVVDLDGNCYVDCLAAASSNVLGYNYNEVAKAYYDVAVKMQNTAFGYSPNVETVELSEKLIQITPGDFPKKVLTGCSGSDACGGAIEAMRRFTGKMGLIAFNHAYHGSTGLSQQASGFSQVNAGIYPASEDFVKMDFPTTAELKDSVLDQIETVLKKGKVGGVIIEPIQGDGGIVVPYPGFIPALRELCDKYKVLLIDDEVQSGMGRTGKWFAIEHENVVPDLIAMGKGLSGGYAPISAVIGRKEVLDVMTPAQQIFTYTGHGPSAAAALEVINTIERDNIMENAARMGGMLKKAFTVTAGSFPNKPIKQVTGRGLMIGIEVDISKDPLASKIFAFRCIEKGVYFGYFGPGQRVVRVEPPLAISSYEVEKVIGTVHQVNREMATGEIPKETVEKVKMYAQGW